ncbi:hypothetical protein HDU97_004466 [Phlyctochytrium planicorne]|nr:hypothetical protein HDU97_004466 [Phlyctochytrium planicorne]
MPNELPRLPDKNPPKELPDADADAAGSDEDVPMNVAANGGEPEKLPVKTFDLERLGKVRSPAGRELRNLRLKAETNTLQKPEKHFCMGWLADVADLEEGVRKLPLSRKT